MARHPAFTPFGDDPRKVRFLDWLCTPPTEREPRTRKALAEELRITTRLLNVWQNKPDFREAWDRQAKAVAGSPERAQHVLDTLYAAAVDPSNRNQVQAAKLYLEATNAIKPQSMEVTVKRAAELSDEELDALLAQGAAELKAERDNVIPLPGADGPAE